jgi:putative hydrolase of the HAD superfamily
VDPLLTDIDAVLFDCGETLVTLKPSREEIFVRAAESVGLKLEQESVRRAYQLVDFGNKYSSVNTNDRQDFYRTYNSQLCEALGISNCFDELHSVVAKLFENEKHWNLTEGAEELLIELTRRALKLGIVANWDSKLPSLAEQLGIKRYFSLIVASQDVGVEKPDPSIFRIALDELALSDSPERVLYVGNEYRADVMGSRAAGLTPVLIDRSNMYPHADCKRFRSLTEWVRDLEEG